MRTCAESIVLRAALSVVGATIACASLAKPPAGPAEFGDGFIDGRRITSYDNAFVVTIYKDGKAQTPGIWTDQLRMRTIDGRNLAVRTQTLGYFDGRILQSVNVFDRSTFAPVSDIQVKPDGSRERWTFSRAEAEAVLIDPSGKEEKKRLSLDRDRYDLNCCMRSLLPAMVHLSQGMTFTVPSVEGADGLTDVKFKVLRREPVRAGHLGNVSAWVVETGIPGGYIHFWIYDRAPYLVRMTLSENSTKAYSQSFDMIEPGTEKAPPPAPTK